MHPCSERMLPGLFWPGRGAATGKARVCEHWTHVDRSAVRQTPATSITQKEHTAVENEVLQPERIRPMREVLEADRCAIASQVLHAQRGVSGCDCCPSATAAPP